MRQNTRRTLIYYLNIKDSRQDIGKLADISLTGLLVFSEDESVSRDYKGTVTIESSSLPQLSSDLTMDIETRWLRRDKSTGLYYYGMEIMNKSPELEKDIKLLVKSIGFSDGLKKVHQGLFFPDFF